jgi:hypothetical protein
MRTRPGPLSHRDHIWEVLPKLLPGHLHSQYGEAVSALEELQGNWILHREDRRGYSFDAGPKSPRTGKRKAGRVGSQNWRKLLWATNTLLGAPGVIIARRVLRTLFVDSEAATDSWGRLDCPGSH